MIIKNPAVDPLTSPTSKAFALRTQIQNFMHFFVGNINRKNMPDRLLMVSKNWNTRLLPSSRNTILMHFDIFWRSVSDNFFPTPD